MLSRLPLKKEANIDKALLIFFGTSRIGEVFELATTLMHW
ncbi:hypothetical protein DOT_2815 [Desulfosporosinus sp. OT]|nr:hypothetical protein DOT_2815 [Desulfosporosinus sp. OT]